MTSLPKPLKCWDHWHVPSKPAPHPLKVRCCPWAFNHIWVSVHLFMDIWLVSTLGYNCCVHMLLFVYMYVSMHARIHTWIPSCTLFVIYSVPSFRRRFPLLFIVCVLFIVPAVCSDPSFPASLSLQYSAMFCHFCECTLMICHGFHVHISNHLWFWVSFHYLTGYVFHIIRRHKTCGLLLLGNGEYMGNNWEKAFKILPYGIPFLFDCMADKLIIHLDLGSGSQFSQVLEWVSFRENNWRVLLMLEFELSEDSYKPWKTCICHYNVDSLITLTAEETGDINKCNLKNV